MTKLITLTVASLALAGMAFAADAEKQDLLASVSNGALCEKDAKALSADEAKQVVGGWWSVGSMTAMRHPYFSNYSYYNALYNQAQRENRPAYKPLFLYNERLK